MKLFFQIITTFLLIAFLQCKNDNETISPTSNKYRTKIITNLTNGIEMWLCSLSYENDKLVQASSYENTNNNWLASEITTLAYNDNTVRIIDKDWYNNSWHENHGFEYVYKNDQLIENRILNKQELGWNIEAKYVYTYNNNLLEKRVFSSKIDGVFREESKYEIKYQNNMVSEIRTYNKDELNVWQWRQKQLFDYSHEDITEIQMYQKNELGEWDMEARFQLIKDNDLVIETKSFRERNESVLWYLNEHTHYLYDTNNYLYKIIEQDGNETEFTLEAGNGNASLFYSMPILDLMAYPSIKSARNNNNNNNNNTHGFLNLKHQLIELP